MQKQKALKTRHIMPAALEIKGRGKEKEKVGALKTL